MQRGIPRLTNKGLSRIKRVVERAESTPRPSTVRVPDAAPRYLAIKVMSPAGGIPAMTADLEPGVGMCDEYRLDREAEPMKWVPTGRSRHVINSTGDAIDPGKLLTAKYVCGAYEVDVDPCAMPE